MIIMVTYSRLMNHVILLVTDREYFNKVDPDVFNVDPGMTCLNILI